MGFWLRCKYNIAERLQASTLYPLMGLKKTSVNLTEVFFFKYHSLLVQTFRLDRENKEDLIHILDTVQA